MSNAANTEQMRRPMREQAASSVEHAGWSVQHPERVVEAYPMSSALVAFALGFGAGIALVGLLTDSAKHEEYFNERWGRQFMSAMSRVLPDSVMHAMKG